MKITIKWSARDVRRVKGVAHEMRDHLMVAQRCAVNVKRQGMDLSHQTIWKKQVGCLLTTRQRADEGGAVQRFMRSNSPLLFLSQCEASQDLTRLGRTELSDFGGIRRTNVIPEQLAANLRWLSSGGWDQIDGWLEPFRKRAQPKERERSCAASVAHALNGFGPKQSRNLLQWLGVTRHEIPLDSRIVNWLRDLGEGDRLPLLASIALAKEEYYCCVMDAIQQLCKKAGVLPCIFDASVFASYERT